MPSVLKSLSSFLLAALLLALTTVGSMGGLAHCAGDGESHHHSPCCLENHLPEVAGHEPAIPDEAPSAVPLDCGCPDGHHHPVASFEMIPLVQLHLSAPVWIETWLDPSPPEFKRRHPTASRIPIPQDRIPPADPPPHLTCGPMLI